MFEINIAYSDIVIKSIEKKDLEQIEKWLSSNQNKLSLEEIKDRFLEYYVSECEFFVKIYKKDVFIGLMKGRFEFKNPNEVWINCFLIDEIIRDKGIGSDILENILLYFSSNYGIYSFYTGVSNRDVKTLEFWKSNKFEIRRVSKNYYNLGDDDKEVVILQRIKKYN